METDLCPICLSQLDDDDQDIYNLDCNHKFHTKCIMEWFRKSKGNCPCCMDNPFLDKNVSLGNYYGTWNYTYINERCSELRKQTRKKNCPEKIKKQFKTLRNKEKNLNEKKKEKREYIKSEEYIKAKEIIDNKRILEISIDNKSKSVMKTKAKIIAKYPCIQTI